MMFTPMNSVLPWIGLLPLLILVTRMMNFCQDNCPKLDIPLHYCGQNPAASPMSTDKIHKGWPAAILSCWEFEMCEQQQHDRSVAETLTNKLESNMHAGSKWALKKPSQFYQILILGRRLSLSKKCCHQLDGNCS